LTSHDTTPPPPEAPLLNEEGRIKEAQCLLAIEILSSFARRGGREADGVVAKREQLLTVSNYATVDRKSHGL